MGEKSEWLRFGLGILVTAILAFSAGAAYVTVVVEPGHVSTVVFTTTLTGGGGIHSVHLTYNAGNQFYEGYVGNYTRLSVDYTGGQAQGTPNDIYFGPSNDQPDYKASGCVNSDTTLSDPCYVPYNFQGDIQVMVLAGYVFVPGCVCNTPTVYGS